MDNIEEHLDLKWLEQVQLIADMNIDNELTFQTTVCSAEFQSWLEGSEGPFLDERDPATTNSIPADREDVNVGIQLANSGAAAVAAAPTGTGKTVHRRSSAGAEQLVASTLDPDLAVKQEIISNTNQPHGLAYMPGMWQPYQQQQATLPKSHHDVQQYQQPLQQQPLQQQIPPLGVRQQHPQQQWAMQPLQQQQQPCMVQPVPQQLAANSSIQPAGQLLDSKGLIGLAYTQPQSAASRVPASFTGVSAPMPHTGLAAVNNGQPAVWPGFNIPQQLLMAAASNGSAPAAAAVGAGGWRLSGIEAKQTATAGVAAAASPHSGRKGSDGSKGQGGSHTRSRSKSSADKDDVDFSGPAITKSGIASRRFRARQKQMMATLEDELTGKLQQLQMLQAENESLRLKESVLASAVESGERQMRLLQESGPPVYDSSGNTAEHTKSSSSSSALQEHGSGHASTPPNSSNTAATGSSTHVAADVGTSSTADSAAPKLGKVASAASLQQQQGAATAVVESAEAVKSMTTEDMLASWKQFLKELTRELMNLQTEAAAAALQARTAAAGDPTAQHTASVMLLSPAAAGGCGEGAGGAIGDQARVFDSTPAAQRLTALVDKYIRMMRLACTLNPGAYCRLFGVHIDTGVPAAYTDDHWRGVLAQVNLSQEQVKRVLACADLYFSHMARLQQERVQLKAKLKQSDVAKEQLLHDTGLNPGSPWLIGLSSNLKREHMLRIMLNRFIWQKILSPLQAAKACIYSHPFYPDWHAIVCILRDMVRGPSSDASLMAAASAAISSSGLHNSRSEADLAQRLLRWREAANASLSQHPRTHLAPGVSFPELA